MKNLTGRILGFTLLASMPFFANAALITYTYSGSITGLDAQIAKELGLSGTVDPFYATIEVDSNSPDIFPDSDAAGAYEISMGFSFGNLSINGLNGAYSTSNFTTQESIAIGASGFNAISGDFIATDVGMSFMFINQNNVPGTDPFILSDNLPLEAIDPNYFRLRNWFIDGSFRSETPHIEGTMETMRVSVNQVPEPPVSWLFLPFMLWCIKKSVASRKQSVY